MATLPSEDIALALFVKGPDNVTFLASEPSIDAIMQGLNRMRELELAVAEAIPYVGQDVAGANRIVDDLELALGRHRDSVLQLADK